MLYTQGVPKIGDGISLKYPSRSSKLSLTFDLKIGNLVSYQISLIGSKLVLFFEILNCQNIQMNEIELKNMRNHFHKK